MEIVIEDEEVTILGCQSQNEGQGEMQGLIDRVLSDHSGKKFFSSIPLNSVMKHILDKKGIEYPKDI